MVNPDTCRRVWRGVICRVSTSRQIADCCRFHAGLLPVLSVWFCRGRDICRRRDGLRSFPEVRPVRR